MSSNSLGKGASDAPSIQNGAAPVREPVLTIIIPTYRPHFSFALSLLDSIARYIVDPSNVEIMIVVERENIDFAAKAAHMFQRLAISWCITEDILQDLSISSDASSFLGHMGKFNFQSIKKIGAILQSKTEWVLVLDSESAFLQDFNVVELLNDYTTQKYVFFTRVADRGPGWLASLSEAVTINAATLVGGDPSSWYLEYYHWFYQSGIWHNIISYIKDTGGFDRWLQQGVSFEIFENVLYYQYVKSRPQLGYTLIDSLEAIRRYLSPEIADRAKQALLGPLQVVGLLEHITSLFSIDELGQLTPLFNKFKLPFVRLEPYTINPAVLNRVRLFPSIRALVSSHRAGVLNRRIAVCVSGEFRDTHTNIRAIRSFTSGVACDIFVHTWNGPNVPAIKDGLAPRIVKIDDRPCFETLSARVKKPEPDLKPQRDIGSMCMFYGIEQSIKLLDGLDDEYGLIVRVRPDVEFQDSLRDIIVMIADDESFNPETVYVPDRFHSQGINDQIAIGSASAMRRYGAIMEFIDKYISEEYFNPEHIMSRHLIEEDLRIKTIPIDYLLLRSEPRDLRRIGTRMQAQDTTWWSAPIPGPPHIREATSLFIEKAKAIDLINVHGCFGNWGIGISAAHLRGNETAFLPNAYFKVEVTREYKNPAVTLSIPKGHTAESGMFLDVRSDGIELSINRPDGLLFIQRTSEESQLRIVRFLDNLAEPFATLTVSTCDWMDAEAPAAVSKAEQKMELFGPGRNSDDRLLWRLLSAQNIKMLGAWVTLKARFNLQRGRASRRKGDLRTARVYYARLLLIAPQRSREWVQYGHVLKDLGEPDEAIAAYEMACSLRPGDADALYHYKALTLSSPHRVVRFNS